MPAHGRSIEALLDEYPQLDAADISACLAYGAVLADERSADLSIDRLRDDRLHRGILDA
jgi:uncharacterized protein (DUF433 family)